MTTAGTNHAEIRSASRCSGARLRCACATSATICDKQAVRADALGHHQHRAGLVERGADHAIARGLVHRQRLAREHGFVEARAALEDASVDRHLFARADAHAIADHQRLERHVLFRAIGAHAPRGLRRETQQLPDGASWCGRAPPAPATRLTTPAR